MAAFNPGLNTISYEASRLAGSGRAYIARSDRRHLKVSMEQSDVFFNLLKSPKKITQGQANAMSRFADYAMEQGGEWKKHFVLEPTANRAMTAAKKADSDAAWDELTTSFSLGADPTEAIKTIGFLKQDVKRQGNIGSLHSGSINKKFLNCLG